MKRRPLCLFCLALIIILFLISLTGIRLLPVPKDLREAMELLHVPLEAEVAGIVDSCEQADGYGVLTIRKSTLTKDGRHYAVGKVRVLYDGGIRYPCGWTVAAEGEAGTIRGPENPGEFDSAAYYRIRGIFINVKKASIRVLKEETDPVAELFASLSAAAQNMIRSSYPEEVSGILCAMLTGDRSGLDEETRGLWRTGGIMHMLAISGLHLTLIGMGIYRLLRFIHIPVIPAGAFVSVLMASYTVFVGCSVSSVRALIMFVLMIGAGYVGRTYDPLTALAAAAVLVLIRNPEYLFYSGFRFSVSAVLLCMIFRHRSKVMMSVFLYLWMLPLVASSYYEVPLLSVGVNLIAVPLLPMLVGCGAAGCAGSEACRRAAGFFVPLLEGRTGGSGFRVPLPERQAAASFFRNFARVLTAPASFIIRALNEGLRFIDSLPFAEVVTGFPGPGRVILYGCLLFAWTCAYYRYRLYRRRLLLFLLLPLLALPLLYHPPGQMKLTFLSVGQGDGALIETPERRGILVDCGSSTAYEVGKRRMDPFIRYEGITEIAYMIATHGDEDHVSGIRELLQMKISGLLHIKLGTLVLPYLRHSDSRCENLKNLAERAGVRVLTVQKGDRISVGSAELRILGPDVSAESVPVDANAQCIVCALNYRDFDALFTGDVCDGGEEQLTRELIRENAQNGTKYEVLKVAHHGSEHSTPESFLAAADPFVSVISCGEGNSYGHPHAELLSRLERQGCDIFRTDRDGAVTVVTDGKSFRVETFL